MPSMRRTFNSLDNNKMNASEARKIYLENRRPFEAVMKSIESTAKGGYKSLIDSDLNPEEMGKLIGLGYSVKKIEKPILPGSTDYLISWE